MSAEAVLHEHVARREWGDATAIQLLCRFIDRQCLTDVFNRFLAEVSDAGEDELYDVLAWDGDESGPARVYRGVPGRSRARKLAMSHAERYVRENDLEAISRLVVRHGQVLAETTAELPQLLARVWIEPTPVPALSEEGS